MDPVGSDEGDGAHGILSKIVAQFQFWIIEESYQSRPDRKRVIARLARCALWQHSLAHFQDVLMHLVEQRRSLFLSHSMSTSVIDVAIARLGVDCEQLVHQFHRVN